MAPKSPYDYDYYAHLVPPPGIYLKECPGCSSYIWEKAEKCPHCGYTLEIERIEFEKKKPILAVFGFSTAVLVTLTWGLHLFSGSKHLQIVFGLLAIISYLFHEYILHRK